MQIVPILPIHCRETQSRLRRLSNCSHPAAVWHVVNRRRCPTAGALGAPNRPRRWQGPERVAGKAA